MMLPLIVLLLITGSIVLTLKAMRVASLTESSNLQSTTVYPTYPTDYPSALQTIETIRRQEEQSAALTPLPTGTLWSFSGRISFTPVPLPPPPSTPAGDGAIVGDGIDSHCGESEGKAMNVCILNSWYVDIGRYQITVFSGSVLGENSQ